MLVCALAIVSLLGVFASGQTPQGFFTDVTPVLTNANFSDFDIAVTGDDLTLVFTNGGGRGGEGGEDMWFATRSDPNLPFENIVNLGPTVNSPENDGVGSIAADGRTLYFGSNRAGDFDLYQATRNSLSEPFDNVTARPRREHTGRSREFTKCNGGWVGNGVSFASGC